MRWIPWSGATNDAPGGTVIGAVDTLEWLDTAQTVTTVTAPESWSGYRFTHWTVSSNPADEFRDPWGRAQNPVSFTLYEHTTAMAHYLPAAQDSNGDGIPDWFKIHYLNSLDYAAHEDLSGDGRTLLQNYQAGQNPRYLYASDAGGISRAMSDTVVVNLAGYREYIIRSEPTGTVSESAIVLPGTVITTPNMTQPTFGYWELDGVPQRDAWGVAYRQISFTMADEDLEAVAFMFTGDSDGDGVLDAWQWYHFGTLEHGAADDLSGDGRTLLQNYQSDQNPLFGYDTQLGGISRAMSEQVVVNLQFYPPDNLGMPSGDWFFSNPYTDVTGEFQLAGGFSAPALGDIFGNGTFDLVVGGTEGRVALWKNAGAPFAADLVEVTGAFDVLLDWPTGPVFPALGDWNGDGRADLVVGSNDGLLRFYETQPHGDPLFVWVGNLDLPAGDQVPAFLPTATGVDLLVLDRTSGQVRHYEWTSGTPPYAGPPVHEDFLGEPIIAGRSLSVGDTDHNGWLDVIVSDDDGRIWDFRGQPDGSFFLQSKVFAGGRDGFHTGLHATLVDFDGDGYLDVIGGGDDGRLVYLRNPSRRLRVNPPLQSVPRLGEIAFSSLDDDGTLVWSIHLNRSGGTIDPETGAYTAGDTAGFDQVLVRNARGRIGSAWVNVLGASAGESSGWHAVLVDGRRSPNDPVWPAAHNLAQRAREVLRYRGLQAGEIVWYGHGAEATAAPTRAVLESALRDGSTLDADTETLLVFLVDHGRVAADGDGVFILSEHETVTGTELSSWLDTLQGARPGLDVLVIVESCYGERVAGAMGSGGAYADRRLVLASSGADELAHMAANGWVSYSMMWWSAAAAGRTIGQAHDSAADAMSTLQTAWSGAGGHALLERQVGLDVAGSGRPVVTLEETDLYLESPSVTIEAEVQSSFILEQVWGLVIPPNYTAVGDAPVVDLPEISFVRNPSSGKWEAQASGFTESGAPYIVIIQARDIWGQVSQPALLRVHNTSVKNRVIVFAPGEAGWSGMQMALELAAYAREVALLRGIAAEDIRFYADHADELMTDGPATASALQQSIENWANADDQLHTLTIFLVGQGSPHGLVCANGDLITHQNNSLRGWINTLQDGNDVVVNLIVDADYSGRFVAAGGGPNNHRIIVTSTGPDDQNRFQDGEWVGVIHWLWEAVAKGANMRDSFAVATEMAALSGPVAAMLDDDGDGVHDRRRDGLLAMQSHVGSAYVTANDPPYIGKASPSREIPFGGVARFWVSGIVMPDGGAPAEVWGEVVGPDGRGRGALTLWRNEAKDRYDGEFRGFDESGTYTLFVRAGVRGVPGRMTMPVLIQFHYDVPALQPLGEIAEGPHPLPYMVLPLTGDYMDVEEEDGESWQLVLRAGQRVVVEAREVARRRDVVLEILRADGALLRSVNEWGPGFGETIRGWEAPEDGTYIVRARFLPGQGTPFCRVRAFVLYETPVGAGMQLALQSLDFPRPDPRGVEDGPLALMASATSGGTVRFVLLEGYTDLHGNVLTPMNVGVVAVRAFQDGDDVWESAVPVTQDIIIALDPEDGYEIWAREIFRAAFDELGERDADLNHNDLSNWQSYVAGISPTDPNARLPQLRWYAGQLHIELGAHDRNYIIESRTDLLDGDWSPWTNRVGSGNEIILTPDMDDLNRYFRYIIRLPE